MVPLRLLVNEGARSVLSPLTSGRASGAIRPTIASVYLTSYCNSKCSMCDFWKRDRDPDELSSEQWGVVFSRLRAFGVRYVGVNASGEMFTRPDVFAILEHLNRLGMTFGINSNGTSLGPTRARRLAALRPQTITIGLDGVGDPAYLQTRGLEKGYTTIVENLRHLRAHAIPNLRLGTVLMRENLDQWVPLAQLALELRLDGIRYTAYHDNYFHEARAPQDGSSEFAEIAEHEISRLLSLKRKTGIVANSTAYLRRVPEFFRNGSKYFPVPCLQGSNRIEIDTFGNVTLCSFVQRPLGNLVSTEMEDIWLSATHRKAREMAREGRCPRCFLSCYSEENLRLSAKAFLPTIASTLNRAARGLLSPRSERNQRPRQSLT